jgi:hypothetical protein
MGTSNSAANAAQAANQQQQQQIQRSVGQINSAFNSPNRQAQIDNYGQNLQNYYTGQVNNQEAVNARNLKFANARSGLTGGSAAVDSNTQLQKDYTNGLLQAAQQAQAGKSALQQADIQSKNQLIGLAQQGNFTGALPQQMATANMANLNNAANSGQVNALNNLFAGTAGIYQNEQVAAANRQARLNPLGGLYGGSTTGGASPYQGF